MRFPDRQTREGNEYVHWSRRNRYQQLPWPANMRKALKESRRNGDCRVRPFLIIKPRNIDGFWHFLTWGWTAECWAMRSMVEPGSEHWRRVSVGLTREGCVAEAHRQGYSTQQVF